MRILYLDCSMGAAGDMLTAALMELLPEPESFIRELNEIGIPGVHFSMEKTEKCGIMGSRMRVMVDGEEEGAEHHHHNHDHHHDHDHHDHDHHHHHHDHDHDHEHHHHPHEHRSLKGIEEIVSELSLPEKVKEDVLAIYGLIAQAEAAVHGRQVEQVHFHEVGMLDAVADVAAVCLLMDRLAPEEVIASPIHVGSGTVRCAHGILPVPAPATAYLLQDIPMYSAEIRGELCTPTGAALLKYFVSRFEHMPLMKVSRIGYGCGKKDFPRANCVRAFLGEGGDDKTEIMTELSLNVDDMTAEEIAFAAETLLDAGAAEVFVVPVIMKKGRPGSLIKIICSPEKKEQMIRTVFQHTSTLGIRAVDTERFILDRRMESRESSWGPVRVKQAEGYGVRKEKIEYEDLARIAREEGLSLGEVRKEIMGS